MDAKEITRLNNYLSRVGMESSLESLVISIDEGPYVHYVSPELEKRQDVAYNLIYDTLKKKNLNGIEIKVLMKKIDDYSDSRCKMYYEFGFKSGMSFSEEKK